MSVEITEGVTLQPPAFADGLDVWSSGNGTPGSDTYENALNAAIVPADQDFAGCMELQKIDATQKLRYMGETPLLKGTYLRVTARVKAVSGNLPAVRIAGWAGGPGGVHVSGLQETGPATQLTQYGEVVEVSAIIGAGNRTGVDMVWGAEPLYGHFGLDLTGPTGGIVRIDDLVIEDVTSVFLSAMSGRVDVRDYGALGDGSTDDLAAFQAADAAANGRTVVVPEGAFHLADSMTFENNVVFEGTLDMPDLAVLVLRKGYALPAYIDAFGDEEQGFRKAFQALLNSGDHESLDMGGRIVNLNGPIDMQAAVATRTAYATRRVIRNGQFAAQSGAAWDETVVTSQASYSTSDNKKLTGVVNAANIPVGALVEGNGVGREVYVKSVNVATQEVTLSKQLHDADGAQVFTFRRFKYMLDFSGFDDLDKLNISDVEFQCNGVASAIMLAPSGLVFHLRDCFISRPKDRGITSCGTGCQGMLIDRCQFRSNEGSLDVPNRRSIAFNTNGNDVKIRNNRSTWFKHFAVIGGSGSIITGNHFFQGDGIDGGVRTAGIVLASSSVRAVVNGNYVDNCFLEWTNEYDSAPAFSSELSFSQLTISDNTFLCSHVAPWFSFIVVRPLGAGHYVNGLSVQGNMFRSIGGNIERVERVDTSFADLDFDRMKNVNFSGNLYNQIDTGTENPTVIRHSENSESQTWLIDLAGKLAFAGWAQNVEAVMAQGPLRNAANVARFEHPYAKVNQGPNKDRIELVHDQAVRGEVLMRVRMDEPF